MSDQILDLLHPSKIPQCHVNDCSEVDRAAFAIRGLPFEITNNHERQSIAPDQSMIPYATD